MGEVFQDFETDKPREECGVYGMWLNERGHEAVYSGKINPYQLVYDALCAQVNRGHQNTGIGASIDGYNFSRIVGSGKPQQAFADARMLDALPEYPRFVLGHNRYTTQGGDDGAQPVHFSTRSGDFQFVGNGEFSNYFELQAMHGGENQPSDHWVWGSLVADIINNHSATLESAMSAATLFSKGAYSIVAMHRKAMYAIRDPHGVRPLYMGRFSDYGWVVASELPTLHLVGIEAEDVQEVESGGSVAFDESGVFKRRHSIATPALCALEGVYLSRDSNPEIHEVRVRSGEILAREAPVRHADVIVPVLGSARVASKAYADALGIPCDLGAIRKRENASRNFLESKEDRNLEKQPKHILKPHNLTSKVVVIGDDSIVRGDTLDYIVPRIAKVAKEVHVRSFSPPIVDLCNLGVDLKSYDELLANREAVEETIQRWDEGSGTVRSLEYLSLSGLRSAFERGICDGCFGGNYPSREVAVWPSMISRRLKTER